ncbi:MAG TPA: HIT family protein [Herpetosiphonaceae bacterium]|nr:HIT family protein [Herpetosiphonaceae bacterium]
MEHASCLVCQRIAAIQAREDPYFVAEVDSGYIVLGDYQFFRGYTLLLSRHHVTELHALALPERQQYLREMSLVAEAVFQAFRPRKLNYELLGNSDPHLHWHLFPRYADDPSPGTTSWKVDKALRYSPAARPSSEALAALKQQLLDALLTIPDLAIRATWLRPPG